MNNANQSQMSPDLNMMLMSQSYESFTTDLAQSLNDLLTSQLTDITATIQPSNTSPFTSVPPSANNPFSSIASPKTVPTMTTSTQTYTQEQPPQVLHTPQMIPIQNMLSDAPLPMTDARNVVSDVSDIPSTVSETDPVTTVSSPTISNPETLGSFIPHIQVSDFDISNEHRKYLEYFYNDYSRVILPFFPMDKEKHNSNLNETYNVDSEAQTQTQAQTQTLAQERVQTKPGNPSLESPTTVKSSSINGLRTPTMNPCRDVLLYYAKRESYVLAAVLACGALISYRYNKAAKDEENYCGYLSTCMSLLSKRLHEETIGNKLSNEKILPESGKEGPDLKTSGLEENAMGAVEVTPGIQDETTEGLRKASRRGKLEGMVITTLLLTSYNASSNIVKWRPHLETAGRLLMHSEFKRSNSNIEGETLAFCRSWFFSIEIIAGLTSSWGGTMNDKDWEVMEKWMDEDVYLLERMQLTWAPLNTAERYSYGNAKFNLIQGYTDKLAKILGKLCCLLRHVRLGEKRKLGEISWFLTQLESREVKEFTILSKTGYLDKNFKYDSQYGVPTEAIEVFDDIDISGDIVYVSWWDICYQAHRLSAVIHTLTKVFMLDKGHFLVVNAIEETVELLRFLRTRRKIKSYSLMMIQFCVFLVGKWTADADHRVLVAKYFSDLHEFGTIAAQHSMKKLEKYWRNEFGDQEDEDIINY